MMIYAAYYLIFLVTSPIFLWLFYLAVMNLKRVRDFAPEKITPLARYIGFGILYIGFILDFLVNIAVLTVILLEFPKETTVSERITRHIDSPSFRGKFSRWLAINFLDPYDPYGIHRQGN